MDKIIPEGAAGNKERGKPQTYIQDYSNLAAFPELFKISKPNQQQRQVSARLNFCWIYEKAFPRQ